MNNNALVLLSGGIDSTTSLALARQKHDAVVAITFNYGQKHSAEIESAKLIAKHFKVQEHIFYSLDPRAFQGAALIDTSIQIPEATNEKKVKSTYVPARNLILLSIAIAISESRKIKYIYFGANKDDFTGFPDCRNDFINSFQLSANLATRTTENKEKYVFETPLLFLEKHEIIALGLKLGVDFKNTVTCYRADKMGRACSKCDSCMIRKKGFQKAGIPDPTCYQKIDEVNLL